MLRPQPWLIEFEFKPPFFVGQLPLGFTGGSAKAPPALLGRDGHHRSPECVPVKLATGSAPCCGCASDSPLGLGRGSVGGSNESRVLPHNTQTRALDSVFCCRVRPLRNTSLNLFPGTETGSGISKGVRLRGWRWVFLVCPQCLRTALQIAGLTTFSPSYLVPREFPEGLSRRSLGLSGQKPAKLGVKH